MRQHVHGRLLNHQKSAECGNRQGLLHDAGIEVGKRPLSAPCRVVHDDLRVTDPFSCSFEQGGNGLGVRGIGDEGDRAGVPNEGIELLSIAGGERNSYSEARELPRE